MIDVNQLRKGATFTQNGNLYRVMEYRHHKPGARQGDHPGNGARLALRLDHRNDF